MSFTEICRRVRTTLGQQHRYAHCVRVARLADRLAQRHGEDPAKARLAGMLHDLARLYSAAELVAQSEARNLPIDAFERTNPVLLHARLGAVLAAEEFGVDDPAILSAIAKHTVAAGEMSRLDCVLYLADGLEPGRNFSERTALESLAMRDLDAAMRETIALSLRFLATQGIPASPKTLAAATLFQEVSTARVT
ncbi:MAG: bis(5'-nucleosyl)-tetraphosphatase (symmetrical) YqeK [Candidatus Baltobacteraceae bacterium]